MRNTGEIVQGDFRRQAEIESYQFVFSYRGRSGSIVILEKNAIQAAAVAVAIILETCTPRSIRGKRIPESSGEYGFVELQPIGEADEKLRSQENAAR
jgi:hypothetical protein